MKNSLVLIGLLAAAVLIFSKFIYLPADEIELSDYNDAVRKVAIKKVNIVDYSDNIFASGKLSTKETSKLSFKKAGRISKLLVREGQNVYGGQLIASLEVEEAELNSQIADIHLDQSQIDLENAGLALERAEREFKNTEALYKDSVANYEQYHDSKILVEQAKNLLQAKTKALDLTKQNKRAAEFNLSYMQLYAPANGIVLKKLTSTNEVIGPGTPVILFGTRGRSKILKINVTDKEIVAINIGDPAVIEFDAFPQQQFEGVVTETAGMADPVLNTFEVIVSLKSNNAQLLPGFIGSIHIQTKSQKPVAAISINALISAHKNTGVVFVMEDGLAVERKVNIYKIDGEEILIDKGLEGGEDLIISGLSQLSDGDEVALKVDDLHVSQ